MEKVEVRVRHATRVSTFLCEGIPLKRDDMCVVRSERGLEFGTCVGVPVPCSEEMERKLRDTVLRKASHSDETTQRQIKYDEDRAKEFCSARISERSLPMKLVDVEYSFDRHRIVFYFTSEERVDFRQLVRDLAQELRARIELRQIQVRDEAKLTGGLGVCGRCLCCSTWMTEFKPISMKMAKRQNLSLNPSKISGQCGRLLCCLSYENDSYVDPKKAARAAAKAANSAPTAASNSAGAPDGPAREKRLGAADTRNGVGSDDAGASALDTGEAQEPMVAGPAKQGDTPQAAPAEAGRKDSEGQAGAQGEGQSSTRRRRGRRRRRGKKRPAGGGSSGAAPSS
jgi:cell fate regulator YaaT (PSP1 superfamily)